MRLKRKVNCIIDLLGCFFMSVLISGCQGHEEIPEVSHINIPLKTYRLEQEMFAADSVGVLENLQKAEAFYPGISRIYLGQIMNADPLWPADSSVSYVGGFIRSFRPMYDSAEKIFRDFGPYEEELTKALKYVAYYFPEYALPNKIITYIGPPDGYGDILLKDAFMVGLHHHLGRASSFYQLPWVMETYPPYLSYRFGPDYISVNCMQSIINDMFPDDKAESSLSVQMIEAGKRLYLLHRLLPDMKDYLLIGYTEEQMEDCMKHERIIWDFLIKSEILHSTEKNLIRNYLGDSPRTEELGEAAPGKIAVFSGWQVVKKYMRSHEKMTLKELMQKDAESILQEAKYKP
jgi:hypothetical protein